MWKARRRQGYGGQAGKLEKYQPTVAPNSELLNFYLELWKGETLENTNGIVGEFRGSFPEFMSSRLLYFRSYLVSCLPAIALATAGFPQFDQYVWFRLE
jgi:hypothetical protein